MPTYPPRSSIFDPVQGKRVKIDTSKNQTRLFSNILERVEDARENLFKPQNLRIVNPDKMRGGLSKIKVNPGPSLDFNSVFSNNDFIRKEWHQDNPPRQDNY